MNRELKTIAANLRAYLACRRATNRATEPALRVACEALESRRLLTTLVGSVGDLTDLGGATATFTGSPTYPAPPADPPAVILGVGPNHARYSELDGTVSVTLANLPAHTMLRVSVDPLVPGDSSYSPYDENNEFADDSDGYTIAYAGETYAFTQGYEEGNDSMWPAELRTITGRINTWIAHTASDLTITLSAVGIDGGEWLSFINLAVSVYRPTVSLTGEGTVIEDDSGSGAAFTVSRDMPAGWSMSSGSGHDPVPETVVTLVDTLAGTATSDVDYKPLPTSLTIAAGAASSSAYYVEPKDDPDAEGIETIFAQVGLPATGQLYELAAPPATAPTTNATTQKLNEDDNPSIKSITVAPFAVGNSPAVYSGFDGYSFIARIVVTGEKLSRFQTKQDINSSTVVQKTTDGTPFALAPDVQTNSNGWKPDVGGEQWTGLSVRPNTDDSEAWIGDNHNFRTNALSTPYNGATALVSNLIWATRYMRTMFKLDTETNASTTFEWGFKFDNSNCHWLATDPIAPPPSAWLTRQGSAGTFYDLQAITGL